jgi:periplasmic protein CpxP/Spy
MDFFQKPKILTIVIIGLLVLNFATLAFLWFRRPPGIHPQFLRQQMSGQMNGQMQGPRDFLIGQLNFSEKQKDDAMKLREEHMKTMSAIQDSIHMLKDNLFDLIAVTPTDSPRVNALVQSIGDEQKKIELSTFYHFQKIRALCDDNQKQKFDKIMKDVGNNIGMGPRGRNMMQHMDKQRGPRGMLPPEK